jgi:hypothetical protein
MLPGGGMTPMEAPMNLSYSYRRGSTLPRRLFHVDVTLWNAMDQATTFAYQVTAPDALSAEEVVGKVLRPNPAVARFRFDLMREVFTDAWNGERGAYCAAEVLVPDTFRHALSVNHR